MNIPVTGRVYSAEDRQTMKDLIDSDEEITYGTYNIKFEKALAEYIGMKYAFFVNSGSSANLLAFAAFTSPHMHKKWRIRPGDEIITLAAGFPTTIAPIVQYGCIPVFVDIGIPHYNIDVAELNKALSPKTRGVFIAHTLGNPFDIDAVLEFCEANDLFLIEDNCDGLGSEYRSEHFPIKTRTGSFGTVSTLSFYPAHHLSTGQGGGVLTDDPLIARIILSLRNWGKDCSCPPNKDNVCGARFDRQYGELPKGYDHKYVFSHFGYNLQGTNILAALGHSQLSKIDEFTRRRHTNFELLDAYLHEMNLPIIFPQHLPNALPSWFGYPIMLTDSSESIRTLATELLKRGVQTRTLFAGNITKQPCLIGNDAVPYRIIGDLQNTDKVMNGMIWVGCWHGLDESHMQYIAKSLKEVL